jgi:hypothetical protein
METKHRNRGSLGKLMGAVLNNWATYFSFAVPDEHPFEFNGCDSAPIVAKTPHRNSVSAVIGTGSRQFNSITHLRLGFV